MMFKKSNIFKRNFVIEYTDRQPKQQSDGPVSRMYMVQSALGTIAYYLFSNSFFIFYGKTDKTHYSVKKCFFLSFLVELRFFYFDKGLRKKRWKVVVHHTLTGGSTFTDTVSKAELMVQRLMNLINHPFIPLP